MTEKYLEELYELLELYFRISPGEGFVKTFDKHFDYEPQLDLVIFREELFARITTMIIGGDKL